MTTFKELGDEIQNKATEVVALLQTIDQQVEALFDAVKNPQVPEEVAAQIRASVQAIQDKAAVVATDDEAPPTSRRNR